MQRGRWQAWCAVCNNNRGGPAQWLGCRRIQGARGELQQQHAGAALPYCCAASGTHLIDVHLGEAEDVAQLRQSRKLALVALCRAGSGESVPGQAGLRSTRWLSE